MATPALPPLRLPSDFLIVGDCGGTNTRLSLWEVPLSVCHRVPRRERAPGTLRYEKKFLNEDFPSFVQIVTQFLSEAQPSQRPRAACLACAGPVLGNTVRFTNIATGWAIDGEALRAQLGIAEVQLVNDFTAMGYGLLTLKRSECYVLNDAPESEEGPVATIGAGTGLGECFLSKEPGSPVYSCFATEGGHSDWPPRDDEEYELLGFLRKKLQAKARVSVERVVSGPGIASIYEFLVQKYPERVNAELQKEFESAGSLKGGVVARNAEKDELCAMAMRVFFDAYASEAGNAMLKWLPTGGFYIVGGIAAKNLKYIADNPRFREIMFDKGRVSPALRQCPVYVTKVDDVGERGAHLVAYNMLLRERAADLSLSLSGIFTAEDPFKPFSPTSPTDPTSPAYCPGSPLSGPAVPAPAPQWVTASDPVKPASAKPLKVDRSCVIC